MCGLISSIILGLGCMLLVVGIGVSMLLVVEIDFSMLLV